jgi:hypothetical protein
MFETAASLTVVAHERLSERCDHSLENVGRQVRIVSCHGSLFLGGGFDHQLTDSLHEMSCSHSGSTLH